MAIALPLRYIFVTMLSHGWIILVISAFWIALSYFFLFRKGASVPTSTSTRKDEDVITFHTPTDIIPDVETVDATPTQSAIPTTQLTTHQTLPDSTLATSPDINDDDLIDLRTLSLDIPNENPTP